MNLDTFISTKEEIESIVKIKFPEALKNFNRQDIIYLKKSLFESKQIYIFNRDVNRTVLSVRLYDYGHSFIFDKNQVFKDWTWFTSFDNPIRPFEVAILLDKESFNVANALYGKSYKLSEKELEIFNGYK